jgi:hypothetical protein
MAARQWGVNRARRVFVPVRSDLSAHGDGARHATREQAYSRGSRAAIEPQ